MTLSLRADASGNSGALQIAGADKLIFNADGSLSAAASPAQFDTSAKLATMAAVQRALGNRAGSTLISANTTLTASQAGGMFIIAGSTTTINLPLGSSLPIGATFEFFSGNTPVASIGRSGSDLFAVNTGTVTFMSVGPGDSLSVVWDGQYWRPISGSAQLGNASVFGVLRAISGYQKLPGGLVFQWGEMTQSDTANTVTALTITFPAAFPNFAVQGFLTIGNNIGTGAFAYSIEGFSATQMTGYTVSPTTLARKYRWFAIGY